MSFLPSRARAPRGILEADGWLAQEALGESARAQISKEAAAQPTPAGRELIFEVFEAADIGLEWLYGYKKVSSGCSTNAGQRNEPLAAGLVGLCPPPMALESPCAAAG